MRSYTNTLLFESALDSITTSNTLLHTLADNLFSPTVQIVEEDCGTLLGEVISVNADAEGRVELSTGLNITPSRITALLSSGTYEVSTRSIGSCISEGGVCQACAAASRQKLSVPAVDSFWKVYPETIIEISHVVVPNGQSTITLLYKPEQYDLLYLYFNGALVSEGSYSISGTTLSLGSPVSTDSSFTIKYAVNTRITYYYWLAETFSGSLFGIQVLPRRPLPLKKELLTSLIPTADVESLVQDLKASAAQGGDFVTYLEDVRDPLEKAIFATMLGSVFLNG
jgi:hypothetical protein